MPDEITAISFDNAVATFGTWMESKLREVDENGKPVHTVKQLLAPPMTDAQRREQTKRALRLFDMAARRKGSGIQVN